MQVERSEFVQVSRFVAAFLVVITHTTFYASERIGSGLGVWHFGEIGVPIFFAISGLVMVLSTTRLPVDAKGAQTFLLRRFVRIVPLYWLATAFKVAVALAAPAVVNHNHFEAANAVKSFLFIPYFNAAGELRPMHGVGWTLLHEVFFYLLFAGALSARLRPVIWVPGAIVALWVVGLLIEDKSAFVTVATSAVNLNFVAGMLAGALLSSAAPKTAAAAAMAGCAVLVGWLVGETPGVVVAFCAAVLLLGALQMGRAAKPFVALGDSSYSLYLFHPFIAPALVVLLGRKLGQPPSVAVVVTCLATVIACHVIHLLIERPVVRRVRGALAARQLA